MTHDRRSVLATIGLALPFGIDTRSASAVPIGPAPVLRLRPFEDAVREAFESSSFAVAGGEELSYRRIEIGHSEAVLAGVQGCHNDRPFAGFPAGHLRIVRVGSGPGPVVHGVRLYVTTVDVAPTGGLAGELPGRPLNFALLPPAPVLVSGRPADSASSSPTLSHAHRAGQKPGPHPRTSC